MGAMSLLDDLPGGAIVGIDTAPFIQLRLVEISYPVARRAAELRAIHNLRLPDAFQLASAIEHGATHFVTNDARLKRVGEIRVLVLEDYVTAASPAPGP
jgi:predicted nucleic acid-binding protein